jgi:hypothetical protein
VLQTIFSDDGGFIAGTWVYVGFQVHTTWPLNVTANVGSNVYLTRYGPVPGLKVNINAREWNELGSVTSENMGAIFQAAGLLHEMGHIYDAAWALSGGSQVNYDGLWFGSESLENQRLVLDKCFNVKM